jgi:hypothetical protein
MELELVTKYLLPDEIDNYFNLVSIEEKAGDILYLFLDERPIKPQEHSDKELISKGFHPKVTIQDFPLRGRAVYLIVRTRKWKDKSTGKVYSTQWDLTAKGTSYTAEFAAFLKELLG